MNVKKLLWRIFIALLVMYNLGKVWKVVNALNATDSTTPQVVYLQTDVLADGYHLATVYLELRGADAKEASQIALEELNFIEDGVEVKTRITYSPPGAPFQCSGVIEGISFRLYSTDDELARDMCREL